MHHLYGLIRAPFLEQESPDIFPHPTLSWAPWSSTQHINPLHGLFMDIHGGATPKVSSISFFSQGNRVHLCSLLQTVVWVANKNEKGVERKRAVTKRGLGGTGRVLTCRFHGAGFAFLAEC